MGQPKGCIPWNKGVTGAQKAWNKGRPVPLSQKEKQQETLKLYLDSLDTEARKRIYGRKKTPEMRQLLRQANLGKTYSVETREKVSKAGKGRKHSPESIQKMKAAKKAHWQDPAYIQKQMSANNVQQNKLECAAAEWLRPLGFQFVGDGQLIVAGKCPDFWDGDTKLVELYGDYWHQNDDPQDRIDLFKIEGYDCLVIWEHEFNDIQAIIARVKEFSDD